MAGDAPAARSKELPIRRPLLLRLPAAHHQVTGLKFVFVLLVVVFVIVFLDDVKLDWVKPDNLQLRGAVVASDHVALVGVRVHVNVGFAFRASSCWQFSLPPPCRNDERGEPA
jgi:hypothetical protein